MRGTNASKESNTKLFRQPSHPSRTPRDSRLGRPVAAGPAVKSPRPAQSICIGSRNSAHDLVHAVGIPETHVLAPPQQASVTACERAMNCGPVPHSAGGCWAAARAWRSQTQQTTALAMFVAGL